MAEDSDGDCQSFDGCEHLEHAACLVVVVYACEDVAFSTAYLEGGDATWHNTFGVAHEDRLHGMIVVRVEGDFDCLDGLGLGPCERECGRFVFACRKPGVRTLPWPASAIDHIHRLIGLERRGDGGGEVACNRSAVGKPEGEGVDP